jgi:hypothetical protein
MPEGNSFDDRVPQDQAGPKMQLESTAVPTLSDQEEEALSTHSLLT